MARTKTNKLLAAINKQLEKRPSYDQLCEALERLEKYKNVRHDAQGIFQSYNSDDYRMRNVEQYLAIRSLLEALGMKFTDARIPQAADTKQFNLDWQGDKTAALFWSSGCGWSIDARKFGKKLGKVWEEFDFDTTLIDNDLDLDSEEFDPVPF